MTQNYKWSFFRAGGVDQVRLTKGADLAALDTLDQKLWVALSCPVKGLECDERTLSLIDADQDGRIHADELIKAAKWTVALLRDPEELAKKNNELPVEAINDSTEDGKVIRETIRALLLSIDKADADAISIADFQNAQAKFNSQRWNGDGVVPPSSAGNEEERLAVDNIIACIEAPDVDKNGSAGITAASLSSFYEELTEYVQWLDRGQSADLRPLGEATDAAFAALQKIRAKVDDFFARCLVAAFDGRALTALNREESEYLRAVSKDLQITAEEISHFPLAHIESDAILPLESGINPAWHDAFEAFCATVVAPLFGPDRPSLTRPEWASIQQKFEAHSAWQAAKKGARVEKLGAERARALLNGGYKAKLDALIAKEEAARPLAEAREKVEKLLYLNRDLMTVANNFVSFGEFYGRKGPAAFQTGTLFIDQRSCDLCIRVNDPVKHAVMSPHSGSYLLYCDLKNAAGESMSIAAAVTDGDVDNLMVGRNGLFYDRKGVAWDATVTRIVENPISIRQAFWSPYKKLLRLIQEQVSRRAEAAQKDSDAKIAKAAEQADTAVAGPPPAPAPPRKLDIGVVAAIGVAVGGITAAIGALLSAFFGLGFWMPIGVLGLLLLISGPSMAIAWLKLRQRNLGPLLDANGWAVNAKARVNVPFGKALTRLVKIPKGSKRDFRDPFAEKRRPWKLYIVLILTVALALGWHFRTFDRYLPVAAQSTTLFSEAVPPAPQAKASPEK